MTGMLDAQARNAVIERSPSIKSSPTDAIGVASRSVLVIEDEVMIAWMIQSILEEAGHPDVRMVSSAKAALEEVSRRMPSIVVSDINLGTRGMDGIDVARNIIAMAHVSFLFVTAHAGASETIRIREFIPGAIILRKPIDDDELISAMRRLGAS